jgi:hypothetical protein
MAERPGNYGVLRDRENEGQRKRGKTIMNEWEQPWWSAERDRETRDDTETGEREKYRVRAM